MLQSHNNCIFCKIINKEIPSTIIEETSSIITIKDIAPKAPIHYLIIPKIHVPDVTSLTADQLPVMADMFAMAQSLGKNHNNAFRLVINNGSAAGQMVFHLHMHFLAGGFHQSVEALCEEGLPGMTSDTL